MWLVIQDGEITAVLALVCGWAPSCWRRGRTMRGRTLIIRAFQLFQCLTLPTRVTGCASWGYDCTVPWTSRKSVRVPLPLDFFGTCLLWPKSIDCPLFSGSKSPVTTLRISVVRFSNYCLQWAQELLVMYAGSCSQTRPVHQHESGEPRRLQFAAFCSVVCHSQSGRPIQAFYHEYMQSNVEQYWFLHFTLH
jgi:hypothetical protein